MNEFLAENQLLIQLTGLWGQITPMIADYAFALMRGIIVLIIGGWLAKSAVKTTRRGLNRLSYLDPNIRVFLPVLLYYSIWVLTIVLVLGQVGVQTTSIIALLGAAGLAIGLALQGTLQNIAAGLMLLILRPFTVGDFIDAGGVSGTVDQIGLFTTDMTTAQGFYMSVPNSNLWNVQILNYQRHKQARLDIDVGIAYGDDINQGLKTLLELAEKEKRILTSPEPQALVVALGDFAVTLRLRCWVPTDVYWVIRYELNHQVKDAIDAAGLTIPFPQSEVTFRQENPAPPLPENLPDKKPAKRKK